jgi:putative ABC transport system permease protein
MRWIALRMLVANRGKYIAIVIGIGFATLLIAQQASIFCGLMLRTSSQIRDVHQAELWISDPNLQFIDDVKPMSENELYKVRGVPGVDWAVRLYKGLGRARLQTGKYQQVLLIGVDDAGMVGAPHEIIMGNIEDLRRPEAVFVDDAGYEQMWPGEPYRLGRTLEMNDRRAVIVGICKALRTFQTFPLIYTRFTQALQFVPAERKALSFILADPKPGVDVDELCRRIEAQTGLVAMTQEAFAWKTMDYYLRRTGIPINFGTTVLLGFLVGTAVAGQTFYMFTLENLRQFGALKAMGASNARIVGMIVLQALVVGLLGYGFGVGLTALFGKLTEDAGKLAFYMPWQVLVGTGAAVGLIVLLSSVLSVRRVLVLEPAIVFRG